MATADARRSLLGGLTLPHTGDARRVPAPARGRTGGPDRDPDDAATDPDDLHDPPNLFGLPATFPDGLGDREVPCPTRTRSRAAARGGRRLEGDALSSGARHQLERGPDSSTHPRACGRAGARLAASYCKRSADGALQEVAPSWSCAPSPAGGQRRRPVEFDTQDSMLTGDFVSVGTRTRLGVTDEKSVLDVELKGTYASGRSDGGPNAWLPIEVFGRLQVDPFGHPFEIYHDGRYDAENSETKYSLLSVATHFGESWGSRPATSAVVTRTTTRCSRPRPSRPSTAGRRSGSSRRARASPCWRTRRSTCACSCDVTGTTSCSSWRAASGRGKGPRSASASSRASATTRHTSDTCPGSSSSPVSRTRRDRIHYHRVLR